VRKRRDYDKMVIRNNRILSDQLAFINGKWYHTEPFETLNGDMWYAFELAKSADVGHLGYYEKLDKLVANILVVSAFEAFINVKSVIGDKVYSEDKQDARLVRKLMESEMHSLIDAAFEGIRKEGL
jgi:hypothetical protein